MRLSTLLLAGLTIAATIGTAVWQGQISNRWGLPASARVAAQKLGEIPVQFGSWRAIEELELAKEVADLLQCETYVNRVYQSDETGQRVTVVVLLGPPGPISVHTPEICYSSQGYKPDGKRTDCALPIEGSKGASDHLWGVRMRPLDDPTSRQQVYYAWSTGGPWERPDNPRWRYRKAPYLYKIQLASTESEETSDTVADSQGTESGTLRFLREFVVAARPSLVSPR